MPNNATGVPDPERTFFNSSPCTRRASNMVITILSYLLCTNVQCGRGV